MWLNRAIVHHSCMYAGVYWSIHACCSWVDIWGKVGGGGRVKHYLIINFISILMQFLTFLKTNSRVESMFASIKTKLNHSFGYIVM